MFVHSVYFWLKDDLSDADRETFVRGVKSLATIESVHACYVGTPAPTNRPIIDRSYSYALTVVFENMDAHDAYQVHPVHDAFRDQCSHLWKKVVIYDSVG